jgi:hypothetical protein
MANRQPEDGGGDGVASLVHGAAVKACFHDAYLNPAFRPLQPQRRRYKGRDMLFQIRCSCGHVGITTSLPRFLRCSACDAARLFRVNDGHPILAALARIDEETDQERRSRKLADERREWARAYESTVAPWRSDD